MHRGTTPARNAAGRLGRLRRNALVAIASLSVVTTLAACGSDGDGEAASDVKSSQAAKPSLNFEGPNGEKPGLLDELSLTDDEIAKVRSGNYTAAFLWHGAGDFVTAVEKGARDEFENLGVRVVGSTEAGFDPAAQANNVQSLVALKPDIIIGTAADPTSAEATFKPILDAGIKLVIMTTPPANYKVGTDFVDIVTENLTEAGKINAELLGEALDGTGKVGFIYYDADFWFTNQRDQAFKDWLHYLYPDIDIVAEAGFADAAKTQDIAASMIARNPDLDGIYVSWATGPAEGVLAALREAGRSDVKVVTNDLDATSAADMMNGGNVIGLVGNGATGIGKGLAISGAYGVLSKKAPELVASVPIAVTKDNLDEAWQTDYGTAPPDSVTSGN